MADKSLCANIVHYSSSRCHRVSRSVMAVAVHALVQAVDMAMIVRDSLCKLLHRIVEMVAYINSSSLFNGFIKNSLTAERRFQIDVLTLKRTYEKEFLRRID